MRHVQLNTAIMTASRLRALMVAGGSQTRIVFRLQDGSELEAVSLDLKQASEVKEGMSKPTAPVAMVVTLAVVPVQRVADIPPPPDVRDPDCQPCREYRTCIRHGRASHREHGSGA